MKIKVIIPVSTDKWDDIIARVKQFKSGVARAKLELFLKPPNEIPSSVMSSRSKWSRTAATGLSHSVVNGIPCLRITAPCPGPSKRTASYPACGMQQTTG